MEFSLLIREGKRHTKLNKIQIDDVHSTSIEEVNDNKLL